MLLALGCIVVVIWLGLALGWHGFWRVRVADDAALPVPAAWPAVAIVIPARDEAETIARAVGSHLAQGYAGPWHVILVDDQSTDGTAAIALREAGRLGQGDRLTIIAGAPLAAGWKGKVHAMAQGADAAGAAKYILFADADIAFAPGALNTLVARAEAGGLALASWMVRLACATPAERALVPAFVWFFALLYPFARVNDPRASAAGAAGGCMLVRADALAAAGGMAAIRGALIDDCTLAAVLKRHGPIWLGLTNLATSLRPYPHFADIARMVSRSAYTQLRHSPTLLAGTALGLVLTYLAPPTLALLATGWPQALGAAAWGIMAALFLPMLRFYRRSPLWAPALPAIAAAYLGFTLLSAWQHMRGRGGAWKGRIQEARA